MYPNLLSGSQPTQLHGGDREASLSVLAPGRRSSLSLIPCSTASHPPPFSLAPGCSLSSRAPVSWPALGTHALCSGATLNRFPSFSSTSDQPWRHTELCCGASAYFVCSQHAMRGRVRLTSHRRVQLLADCTRGWLRP